MPRSLVLAKGASTAAPAAHRQNEIASGSASSAYLMRMADAEAATVPMTSTTHGTQPGNESSIRAAERVVDILHAG